MDQAGSWKFAKTLLGGLKLSSLSRDSTKMRSAMTAWLGLGLGLGMGLGLGLGLGGGLGLRLGHVP